MNRGHENFPRCNADVEHQRLAGIASWCAFSARWRARQGLPLLHPMDVQYLTPQDFRYQSGQPLPPTEQRRLFRQYVEQALALEGRAQHHRRPALISADPAFVRSQGFVRSFGLWQQFVYGRQDIGAYEPEALLPTRPYGIPVTSETFPAYWLGSEDLPAEDDNGDESWIERVACDAGEVLGIAVPTESDEGDVSTCHKETW